MATVYKIKRISKEPEILRMLPMIPVSDTELPVRSTIMPGIVVSGFQKVAGYTEENFGKSVARFGKLLVPQDVADGVAWLLALPPHVNVSELMIRPTGQPYP